MPQFFRRPMIARVEPRPISRSALRGDPARRLSSRMPVSRSIPRASEVRATEETRVARPDSISSKLLGAAALGAATFLTLFGCPVPNNNASAADTANPSVVDAGIADVTAEAEISTAVAAPVTRIYGAGALAEALRLNRATDISFTLPGELRDLFGQVKFFGIIGPRMDRNNRSPFSVAGFAEQDGTVTASITALRGAFSSEEGAINTWHLVLELGEGEQAKYCWYELIVQGGGNDNSRRDGGHRRDDAGATQPDVPAPPRDVTTREARGRMGA